MLNRPFLAALALALSAAPLVAQQPVPKIEKYDNGAVKSQTTTTLGADGKTKVREVRTEYDKDGRPIHESDRSFDGAKVVERHEQTWVYDDKGRQIYYESDDESRGGSSVMPGIESRHRQRKSYNGDKDTEGTIDSEQVYTSVTGKWRDFDGEGGDTRPTMKPLQPLPEKPKPDNTPKPKEEPKTAPPSEVPPPTTPLGGTSKPKKSAPNDDGLPDPPPPRIKIYGKILWELTPDEASENNIGFGGGATFALMPRLSIVAEVTRASGSSPLNLPVIPGVEQTDFTFTRLAVLGGVQHSLMPVGGGMLFAQATAGLVHDTTRYAGTAQTGTGYAIAIGVGLSFATRAHVQPFATFDYMPTHFEGGFQQAMAASGGAAYGIGQSESGGTAPPAGGSSTVSLENPFAGELGRAEDAVRRTKGPNDKAEAEIEKSDPAWMKKNLTADGQKDVEEAKAYEKETQADFDKATTNLKTAEKENEEQQTQASFDKEAKARQAVRDAANDLKNAHRERIRKTKAGFTKEAKKYYSKILDDHWQALQKRDELKRDFEKWNKEHGVK